MGSSSSTAVLSKDSKAIQDEVNRYPVVVYTKDYCSYCISAKKDLNEDGVFYVERNFSDPGTHDGNIQGLVNLTHCRTVPQLFVCGKFIGGYAELRELRKQLPKMIAQCSSDGKSYDKGSHRSNQ